MEKYIEIENGGYIYKNITLSNKGGGMLHQKMIKDIESGKAEIIPFDHAAKEKSDALAKIKTVKKSIRTSGFEHDGSLFIADDKAQSNLTSLVLSFMAGAFPEDKQIPWKLSQGEYYIIDGKENAVLLASKMAEFVQKCFLVEGQMVEEVSADHKIKVEERFKELMSQ